MATVEKFPGFNIIPIILNQINQLQYTKGSCNSLYKISNNQATAYLKIKIKRLIIITRICFRCQFFPINLTQTISYQLFYRFWYE